MENENRSYRIRTQVGSDAPNVINVKLNQTFEFLNILSLKIGQKNLYKMPAAPYGIVCGRVLLGGKSFGIQNAKVSIFIPKDSTVFDVKDDILYTYSSVDSVNYEGVRYNLLPSYVDNACHQNVGTMFEKEYVLDNNDVIRIFDNYYSYTTTTNNAGDYFIYGVPVGQYTLHVDVDLSDIGQLSVRPHDMIGQGYNIDQFESPNKFKADKNLNILPQIKSTNKPVYIYPFWGDTSENDTNAMITRADIEIDYKFEPTAVFIGSIVTDKGSNSISHKCVADDRSGKMSELVTGEGMIEMIRKTFDGKVEQFSVKGNRLIDGDGVWCYQVPMNLDYVVMDEFGNIVPTDNPDKGLPTRARVRFRISLDENPMDDSARKRARFLVPNNPRLTDDYPNFSETHEVDYEFGTFTKEESYRDMFWNNVYTVKSYIPRLQKRSTTNTKKYTGIKMTNHAGDNNPIPFNNLAIRMGFVYRFLCVLLVVFINVVGAINVVLALLGYLFMAIGDAFMSVVDWHPLSWLSWLDSDLGDWAPFDFLEPVACWFYKIASSMLINLGDFCDDGNTTVNYMPGPGIVAKFIDEIKRRCRNSSNCFRENTEGEDTNKCSIYATAVNDTDRLINCVQNALAQDNEVTSFDFQNDWINGVLYAPLWYRKIKPKRRLFFGLIKVGGQDDWCDGNSSRMAGKGGLLVKGLKLYHTCAQQRRLSSDKEKIEAISYSNGEQSRSEANCYGLKCHKRTISIIQVDKGIIIRKETKYGEYVYYYKSVEYDKDDFKNVLDGSNGDVKLLFATDLVLLGSLNDCDTKGVPQFFKHLGETTYNMPPDLLSITWKVDDTRISATASDEINDSSAIVEGSAHTEYTGADWGNAGYDQWYKKDKYEDEFIKDGEKNHDNGGLFYGIDCNWSFVKPKSCVNLSRVCEFGVTLDQSISFLDGAQEETIMPPDGYISYDELYNSDARAMFATMNGNRLRERQDPKTGFPTYDFNYMYPENFDGTLKNLMNEVNYHPGLDPDEDGYPNNTVSAVKYRKNYNLEQSSDSYLRFRYGFNRNKFGVAFYNNDIKLGIYKGASGTVSEYNRQRFPRYENSFYFYFGLKTGKTAIDKFRKNFYAECTNDAEGESAISIEYSPNSWCTDTVDGMRDGWLSFDLSNVELPCAITLDERNQGTLYDVTYTDINSYKLYIGIDNTELNNKGYDRLYVDDDNKQKPASEPVGTLYHPVTVANGYYIVTITDANGEQFRQSISFENPKVKYDPLSTSFTMTNDELATAFPPIAGQTTNQRVASCTVHNLTGTNYIRDIGGYITVTNITNDGIPLTDNFLITIRYINEELMPDYEGSDYRVLNGVITKGGIQPLSEANGEYIFGVPRANENYIVRVCQLCEIDGRESGNYVKIRVFVSEPQPFKMFVNGIDTSLLSNFRVGYGMNSSGVINAPYAGYNESDGVRSDLAGSVRGWLSINDIGVSSLLSYPPEGQTLSYAGTVENTINALRGNPNTDLYTFTDEYTFQDEDVNKELETYAAVPQTIDMDSTPKYIRVKRNSQITPFDPFDEVTWIYELVNGAYQQKLVGGQPVEDVTIGEYFDACDYYGQCEVINVVNEIINRRLGLVNNMINAFWMYDNNEVNKTISITYQTNETPVKTVAYYIPDEVNATRIPQQSGSSTRYVILDTNMNENTITSFSNPTITKNALATKPIFFKDLLGSYKLPPHCGIKNKLDVTIPKTLTAFPFSQTNITTAMSSLHNPEGMANMFGFHVIDKRPFTKTNIWIPIFHHPIYWPDIISDPEIDDTHASVVDGFVEGGYINMNGCLSGFFYNGFSTSQTHEAEFITQKATDKVELYTITVNGDGNPDEFAVPTKRLMYRKEPESTYVFSYNDFKKSTNPKQNFDVDSQNTGGVNTDYRYISYTTSTPYFTISDDHSTFNEELYPTSIFGIPEDTVIMEGVILAPKFTGIEQNVQFTIVNDINPMYRKVYNNNEELPTAMNYNMTYNAQFPVNVVTTIPNGTKRFYCIGYTTNGKYRGISPTYEIGAVDVKQQTVNNHYALSIKFTNDPTDPWNIKDYYLRKYPYQFIIVWTETVDDHTVNHEIISDLINPSGNVQYTTPYEFTETFTSPYTVYVKDVTGIRRKVNFVH